MILEVAILTVIPGEEAAFEQAMQKAKPLIAATPGFGCDEDHTIGFRQSSRYKEWRTLLHHFYSTVQERARRKYGWAEGLPVEITLDV